MPHSGMKPPFFSIVVPSFNEEGDIRRTLMALRTLDYPHFEVIMVDDASTDRTREVALETTKGDKRFQLLEQGRNQGVSAARNRGVKCSKGEVVVILNADVILPADFLHKIGKHYENGAHWVSVWCNAVNRDRWLARYTQVSSDHYYLVKKAHFVWTEGFSCRRESALSTGLFPESMPGCSGEDGEFGLRLERNFKGVKDLSIVVPHMAPDTLPAFWLQYRGRGQGRTNVLRYMRGYSHPRLLFSSVVSTLKRVGYLIFGGPLWHAFELTSLSEKGRGDIIRLAIAGYIAHLAQIHGIWRAYFSSRSPNSQGL